MKPVVLFVPLLLLMQPEGACDDAGPQQNAPYGDHLVRFGAGASLLVPSRPADGGQTHRTLPEFAAGLSPFGWFCEVGVDLAIDREAAFHLRPNVKLFFLRDGILSLYLEGAAAFCSGSMGTHTGGGGGLGIVCGLSRHMTFEFRAHLAVFRMPAGDAGGLLGLEETAAAGPAATVWLPGVGARMMARF